MKDGNKSFLKSISILTTGSAISMIFLLILHFVSPKIFTPEELGIKTIILAVPTAFNAMLCGRYDLCLVYEEDETRIPALLKLNFIINISLSTLVTVLTYLYFLVFKQECIQYWYLLPAIWVYLVANGLTLILNSYNNRYREYGMISKMHVLRVAAQCMGTVIPGLILVYWLKLSVWSIPILIVPYCLGMACGIRSQSKGLRKRWDQIRDADRAGVRSIAKDHIRQPLLSAPAIFANSFSYSLISMLTNGMYGDATTGLYSLSITLLGLPISLIAGNMSKVYMRDASKEYKETRGFRKAFRKNCLVLTAIAIPLFFCMFFLAPPVCVWFFGEKWLVAGEYIKALALMFSFRFVATALSPGLYVCRKQLAELLIQIGFLVVTAIVGLIAALLKLPALTFMWVLGGARSFVMLVQIMTVAYYAKGPREKEKKLAEETVESR